MTHTYSPEPLDAREAAWFRRQHERGYPIAAMARELRITPKRLSLLAKVMGFHERPKNGPRLSAILPPLPRCRPLKPSDKPVDTSKPVIDGDLRRWNSAIVPGWTVHDSKKP